MRAIAQAGRLALSVGELVRLQLMVIEDTRFGKPGLQDEGGFIQTRQSNPVPFRGRSAERPSEPASAGEFAAMSDAEIAAVQDIVEAVFEHSFDELGPRRRPPDTEVDETVFGGACIWPSIRTCCS